MTLTYNSKIIQCVLIFKHHILFKFSFYENTSQCCGSLGFRFIGRGSFRITDFLANGAAPKLLVQMVNVLFIRAGVNREGFNFNLAMVKTCSHRLIKTQIGHARDFA